FVFFSRSLYQPIIQQIDKWIRYFSNNQQQYDAKNKNLQVLHSWGSRQQPGFYRTMCKAAHSLPLSVIDTDSNSPIEALAQACVQLLKDAAIPQLFDAILIDEGQDLISDHYQFAGKQPFYWLAYQSLRSVSANYPQQKRLIFAYDEVQNLEAKKMPTAAQIFGEELGNLFTGKYPGGIKKIEIMRRCYRTPQEIIAAAHALAMGWLRPTGMLAGMSSAEQWKSLGYEVEGQFVPGQQ
ncbi:MAG: DNA/RNA helicase, partial [Snowella sp.]